ncbi:hypothetical protein Hanom_Chr10g00911811 [Helianthus anomalus]
MRNHGIGHIVGTILDAHENATVVNELKERAREAAVEAYNNLSISVIGDIDKCLEAEDYVDRLRLLYGDPEQEKEEEIAGSGKGDVGTSGTKEV